MSAVAAPPPAPSSDAPAPNTVGAYAKRWWTDVKSGELGSLPIFVGLIIIAIVFQSQNDRFLTASNFVNLILQTAPYAVIAMGVTFVLLLGEIDLSIGFVSGVGGVMTAILLTPDGNELPVVAVFAIVFGAGLASSFGEAHSSLESDAVERLPFSVKRSVNTPYKHDAFQPRYLVSESLRRTIADVLAVTPARLLAL